MARIISSCGEEEKQWVSKGKKTKGGATTTPGVDESAYPPGLREENPLYRTRALGFGRRDHLSAHYGLGHKRGGEKRNSRHSPLGLSKKEADVKGEQHWEKRARWTRRTVEEE